MSREHVTVERADAVGRLVMDRPERHNAMNGRMLEELCGAAVELVADDAVRCLVLAGAGGAGGVYNTGADLTTLSGDERDGAALRRLAGRLHAFVGTLVGAPKPVVTAVNGVAAGGGVGPALLGDVVLFAESARVEFAYPRIGLSADGGSTYFLPRLVGLREAQRIVLRDEPVGAGEAADLGLATEAVPDEEFEAAVDEEARRLAGGPTAAYAETRRLLHESFGRELGGQHAAEAESLAGLTATGDYARGIEAFLSGGTASFEGE